MKKIYVITGQTATRKTSYAVNLSKEVNGELINCDSRQIYKELDIITGKDLDKTTGTFKKIKATKNFDIGFYTYKSTIRYSLSAAPIWLYDVVDPSKQFSPYDYQKCATDVVTDIISRDKTPIIVGGTYFYLKNLLYKTIQTHVEPNQELRNKLNKHSVSELQDMLSKIDSDLFKSLNNSDRNNPHRLIRKIEILKGTSNKSKTQPSLQELFPTYEITVTGFKYASKKELELSIQKRVEDRIEKGAIDEVKLLLKTYSEKDPGLQTIGYKQIISLLQRKSTYEEMKQDWITKEIQYAKRQRTFMNQNENIEWNLVDSK